MALVREFLIDAEHLQTHHLKVVLSQNLVGLVGTWPLKNLKKVKNKRTFRNALFYKKIKNVKNVFYTHDIYAYTSELELWAAPLPWRLDSIFFYYP